MISSQCKVVHCVVEYVILVYAKKTVTSRFAFSHFVLCQNEALFSVEKKRMLNGVNSSYQ